ncbi:hypothetical protein RRG08_001409 [Elysia crispata]|uniref:Uncharacterized protein n=1 Tax=Elysia crispata TaxID=231223 RepID=A0AAE0ZQF0_9GAST|nr:hypothetical protein RRG08_001409 [Elysia crispata]
MLTFREGSSFSSHPTHRATRKAIGRFRDGNVNTQACGPLTCQPISGWVGGAKNQKALSSARVIPPVAGSGSLLDCYRLTSDRLRVTPPSGPCACDV